MSTPGVMHQDPGASHGGVWHESQLIWRLARWEFRLLTRGPSFWLAVLAASVGTVPLAVDGDFGPMDITGGLAEWILLVVPLVFLPVLGSLRRRDAACGIHELVHSRPLSALACVAAKFLAGWAALAATWLVSMAVGAVILTAVRPQALLYWPEVLWMSALLSLPCYAFVTGLALVLDALTGRTGVVLAVGALVVIGSFLLPWELRAGNLAPAFQPLSISPVFGFDPYAGVVWLNRAWTLSLTAGLMALALWLLPRKTPVRQSPSARPLAALLAAVLAVGGVASAVPLLRAPAAARWREEAQEWEMQQVRAAADSVLQEPYWVRHLVETPAGPLAVYLARGHEEAAEPLAEAAARLLPHFPELQSPPGEPLRIFEGSYLREARLERGSLVVLSKDVRIARKAASDRANRANRADRPGRVDRVALRAMTDAYWFDLAQIPAHVPGETWDGFYLEFLAGNTWAAGAALYHQWVVLEQTAGPEALAAEQQLWERMGVDRDDSGADPFQALYQTGAIGYSGGGMTVEEAFELWAAGQALGHDQVLAALRTAAERVGPSPENTVQGWFRWSKRYWETFCAQLGVEAAEIPPYFRWPAASAGR